MVREDICFVPRAMYSFSMSFCIVPSSLSCATPCFSATAMYIESNIIAVLFIVIDVLTLSSGIPSKSMFPCLPKNLCNNQPFQPRLPTLDHLNRSQSVLANRMQQKALFGLAQVSIYISCLILPLYQIMRTVSSSSVLPGTSLVVHRVCKDSHREIQCRLRSRCALHLLVYESPLYLVTRR